MDYIVPAKKTRVELRIKNSRFIATVNYTPTVESARGFIQNISAEFPDATHNVPAYIVGNGASVVEHCNDDGEPGGTAGRPMLAVLNGSGFGDIAVVVTRYFGGTKLGTGGLVQAYSAAAKALLETVPKARKTMITRFSLTLPYSNFEPVKRLAEEMGAEVVDATFAADVTVELSITKDGSQSFRDALTERWPTSLSMSNPTESPGLLPMT